MCDYVATALSGKGTIIIGDIPSIDAGFEELMEFTGIRERMAGKYDYELVLRPLVCTDLNHYVKYIPTKRDLAENLQHCGHAWPRSNNHSVL